VIGKQENLVDYQMDRDTVSRLHLRIDRDDGRYYITDLNSSNGTMLHGRLLENNEKAEVRPGDEVSIAQFRFVFR
jgi:pSer/pThr/pTyr-binding forkhead associated (FHA) protein